jgi:hypothetical protein
VPEPGGYSITDIAGLQKSGAPVTQVVAREGSGKRPEGESQLGQGCLTWESEGEAEKKQLEGKARLPGAGESRSEEMGTCVRTQCTVGLILQKHVCGHRKEIMLCYPRIQLSGLLSSLNLSELSFFYTVAYISYGIMKQQERNLVKARVCVNKGENQRLGFTLQLT